MKKAIRTSNINIDTVVPDSFQWVNATIQSIELDDNGKIMSVSPNEKQLHRRIDKVANQTVDVYDPILGQKITLSVAGIGIAIKNIMVEWMIEDNPNYYIDGDRVVRDGTS